MKIHHKIAIFMLCYDQGYEERTPFPFSQASGIVYKKN